MIFWRTGDGACVSHLPIWLYVYVAPSYLTLFHTLASFPCSFKFRISLPWQSYFVLDLSHLDTLLLFLGFVSNTKPYRLSASFRYHIVFFEFLFVHKFFFLYQSKSACSSHKRLAPLYQFVRGRGFGTEAPLGLCPKAKASFDFLNSSLIFLTSFPSPLLLLSSSHFFILYWYDMPPAFVRVFRIIFSFPLGT
jgi:hypothetical protein